MSDLSVASYEYARVKAHNYADLLKRSLEYQDSDQVLDYVQMKRIGERLLHNLNTIKDHIDAGIGGPL